MGHQWSFGLSTAAMAGAIVGARTGVEGIPSGWQATVIAREQILLRAEALLTRKKDPGWRDLIDYETELTCLEAQDRTDRSARF